MKVKITCTCMATFEIKDGSMHPKEISCPNCGMPLPDGAYTNLLSAMSSFEIFESKLAADSDRYGISYSRE